MVRVICNGSSMLRIGIPDDYADMVRTFTSFHKIAGHPVSIWTDAAHDLDDLADRLKEIEALVLIRERTPISAALLARLPKLKLITISGPYPNVDLKACTAHGVVLCAAANRPTLADSGTDLGAHHGGDTPHPAGGGKAQKWRLAKRHRRRAAWPHAGRRGLRPHRQGGRGLWPRVRHAGPRVVA